eukprot:1174604-Alexandrium_andersonii.AAC.1
MERRFASKHLLHIPEPPSLLRDRDCVNMQRRRACSKCERAWGSQSSPWLACFIARAHSGAVGQAHRPLMSVQ